MKTALLGFAISGLCATAHADMIHFNGQDYETIQWSNASSATNVATGSAGGVNVTFNTVDITTDAIKDSNYGSAAGFDALDFSDGSSGSITLMGGSIGTSSLVFDQSVNSVLILIGSPNDTSTFTQFGAAIWDFSENINLSLLDNEGNPGIVVDNASRLYNTLGPSNHHSGVALAEGEMTSLQWDQSTSAGTDQLQITFAIVPTIPAPSAALALLLPGVLAGRRRR